MYTEKEDQIDKEDIINPNWELSLDNILNAIDYIHNNMPLTLDCNRLNWKFTGSKKYPSITICMYDVEMLTPVYSVKNPFGKTPVIRNDYPTIESLISAIVTCYQNHTCKIIQEKKR